MAQAEARQRALTSIDVSDPRLYQDDIWRPLLSQLRRDDPVHYGEASRFDLQEEICNGTFASRSWARHGSFIPISFAAFARCRCE
jgi:hypothetical protein